MLKIGLTGGIGSGKSHVADILGGLGASIIDTDAIAHALSAPGGSAIEAIKASFGADFITPEGALDRARMREQVFADDQSREQLQAILHPLIASEVQRQAAQAQGLYTVFVVPLLVESGRWVGQVDRVCVVDCDRATQISRVQARNGLSQNQIEGILKAQASREQRLAVAHDVLENHGDVSLEYLRQQVLGLHQQWCNLASC
jgi:dephospho-CoA kinase